MDTPTCPICHHTTNKLRHRLKEGALITCQKCQGVFFSPLPTDKELNFFYNHTYHNDFSQSTMAGANFAHNRYQQLEKLLTNYLPSLIEKPNRRVLDVGCGTGDFLKAAQQAGWHITGTEFARQAVKQASQKIGSSVLLGDIVTINLPTQPYDLITSYHVIEHLLNPVGQLKRCHQLLAPHGALFVETPNITSLGARIRGAKWSHIIPPEHIVYFSPDSLEFTLRQAGFNQVVIMSSSPQVVESVKHWPRSLQKLINVIYNLAPHFNMGAALQAIAFKD